MIEITCMSDIEKLNKPNIPIMFKNYIQDYLSEMLLRFDCDNLSNLGSIFVLEEETELEKYSPSNASQFLNIGLIIENNKSLNITQLFFFEKSYTKIVFVDSSIIENYVNKNSAKGGINNGLFFGRVRRYICNARSSRKNYK